MTRTVSGLQDVVLSVRLLAQTYGLIVVSGDARIGMAGPFGRSAWARRQSESVWMSCLSKGRSRGFFDGPASVSRCAEFRHSAV